MTSTESLTATCAAALGLLTFVFLCVPVIFTDNARCQFTVGLYGFPVAMMVAVTLIAHIFHSDYRDTSRTVLHLYHCVMGGT